MIKRNQKLLNITNGLIDIAINIAAFLLAYWLRFVVLSKSATFQPLSNYSIIIFLNSVVCLIIYILMHLYEPKRRSSFARDAWVIIQANLIDLLLLGMGMFVTRFIDFSRSLLVFYFIISTAFVITKHGILRVILQKARAKGRNLKHVLLVGSGRLAKNYQLQIANAPKLGYHISGIISCGENQLSATCLNGIWANDNIDKLSDILGSNSFDEVVIALDEDHAKYTKQAIEACNLNGTRFSVIPYFTEYCFSATVPEVQNIGTAQIFDICASPLDKVINRFGKRVIDVIAAILILIATSPIMLLSALLIKTTSKGPVFFKQERVGRDKELFDMYKFRSMRQNTDEETAWSRKGDPRVTGVGKFMRKTSIDELPQLFNIIKGDMSLVGPRPEIPYHVKHFKHEIPYYMARHQIRPGLTGWAQVHGLRGNTSIEKRVQYDLYYIYNWTIALDFRIILKTIFGGVINEEE